MLVKLVMTVFDDEAETSEYGLETIEQSYSFSADVPTWMPLLEGFFQGLKAIGYVPNQERAMEVVRESLPKSLSTKDRKTKEIKKAKH